jgi:hypothetical protein
MPPLQPSGLNEYQAGVISGKLDMLLIQGAEKAIRDDLRFASAQQQLDAHDARLDTIEKERSWVLGGAATITAALGGLATYLGLK